MIRRLAVVVLVALAAAASHGAIRVVTRFKSPKNAERPMRAATTLIVLHTTEAPAKSALRHLSDRGECHYCVTEDGQVYQIVERGRVAFHAGCSMWNGREEVDNFSVGIECVGYHDKAMPMAQIKSISAVVKYLQKLYNIPDHNVVTHSQVAYGNANKWQKRKHRGRKRCGMLFAMPSVRNALGLKSRAAFDPDVKARRLVVGDELLAKVLYGKPDTMKRTYGAAKIAYVDPTVKPKPTGKPGATPAPPSSSFRKIPQSIAELQRQGFESIGSVSKTNLPGRIAGPKWNASDTYYTLRGRVIPGNVLDPRHVEAGMSVWRPKKKKAVK